MCIMLMTCDTRMSCLSICIPKIFSCMIITKQTKNYNIKQKLLNVESES